jgi:hypothetical protein
MAHRVSSAALKIRAAHRKLQFRPLHSFSRGMTGMGDPAELGTSGASSSPGSSDPLSFSGAQSGGVTGGTPIASQSVNSLLGAGGLPLSQSGVPASGGGGGGGGQSPTPYNPSPSPTPSNPANPSNPLSNITSGSNTTYLIAGAAVLLVLLAIRKRRMGASASRGGARRAPARRRILRRRR